MGQTWKIHVQDNFAFPIRTTENMLHYILEIAHPDTERACTIVHGSDKISLPEFRALYRLQLYGFQRQGNQYSTSAFHVIIPMIT